MYMAIATTTTTTAIPLNLQRKTFMYSKGTLCQGPSYIAHKGVEITIKPRRKKNTTDHSLAACIHFQGTQGWQIF